MPFLLVRRAFIVTIIFSHWIKKSPQVDEGLTEGQSRCRLGCPNPVTFSSYGTKQLNKDFILLV